MSNDTFFLPPWAVKRTGEPGILLRDETVKDIEGNKVNLHEGDKVMVTGFTQGAVNPETGRIYGDEVFCCLYIIGTFNPMPFYIRAKHVHLEEAHSNMQTYTDINALDFFKKAMMDESGRTVKTIHEFNFNEDKEEEELIKHVIGDA